MAKFIVEIDTDGAAFDGDSYGIELAALLRRVAARAEYTLDDGNGTLRDSNGNTVGTYRTEKGA
jgi:hypothetical protein